jgi:transposase
VVCIDELGPLSVRSHPGQLLVRPQPQAAMPAQRATQELDYGRRTTNGYVFGAFQPATGEALTATYTRRTTANFIDFLDQVEAAIPAAVQRVYVILDNLAVHKADDVLLFNLAHPRWEFVFQPRYAAYLNLIEPWWKTLKSLAFKGRQFLTWEALESAIAAACAYWNTHRHPYVWGRRRRQRVPRHVGIACVPRAGAW